MGCLLMPALGLPALLTPGRLAAGPRAVAVTPIAATADRERPSTPPAVAQMKNRNLAQSHPQPPALDALDNRRPLVRGS